MKWFKHMTASWDDEKLAALVGDGGSAALARYGAYWLVCEAVSEQGQRATLTLQVWAKKLRMPVRQVMPCLERMQDCGLVQVSEAGCGVTVAVPGLVVRESDPYRLPWAVWSAIRERIFRRDRYTCQYCGALTTKPECDHMVPVSRGGTNEDDNLATACVPCNRAKGAKTAEEFAV